MPIIVILFGSSKNIALSLAQDRGAVFWVALRGWAGTYRVCMYAVCGVVRGAKNSFLIGSWLRDCIDIAQVRRKMLRVSREIYARFCVFWGLLRISRC